MKNSKFFRFFLSNRASLGLILLALYACNKSSDVVEPEASVAKLISGNYTGGTRYNASFCSGICAPPVTYISSNATAILVAVNDTTVNVQVNSTSNSVPPRTMPNVIMRRSNNNPDEIEGKRGNYKVTISGATIRVRFLDDVGSCTCPCNTPICISSIVYSELIFEGIKN
ncbi:hypothetical protein [Thermoflexibacter ruber]|uniref:Lipoprotein n=1 Tax=Thermoflexibacter ruber TaxID=1003 RepID=A0A1I2AG70_9BACT|nr:hypothetical protein [Thermoflexibacter ruber]SFE41820.1 hypothetical protein SAMN04488541_1001122 [Thermoflexibacter ruber]